MHGTIYIMHFNYDKKIPCCSFLCMCGADKFIDINIDLLSNFIVYVSNVCTFKI